MVVGFAFRDNNDDVMIMGLNIEFGSVENNIMNLFCVKKNQLNLLFLVKSLNNM